jgi:hypothetical protein
MRIIPYSTFTVMNVSKSLCSYVNRAIIRKILAQRVSEVSKKVNWGDFIAQSWENVKSLQSLDEDFLKNGGMRERMTRMLWRGANNRNETTI